MIALVEGLRAWGALAADPELLGPSVREWGLRRPVAIGSHGKSREGLSAVEDDLRAGRGLVGDGCVRFAGIFPSERNFLSEAVGACRERYLDGLLEWAGQFADGAAGTIKGSEWAVGVGGIWLGQFARPVVVTVRGDMQFD